MKTKTLILTAMALLFIKCKKDWTCTCMNISTDNYTGSVVTTQSQSTGIIKSQTQSHAQALCSSDVYTTTQGTNTSTYNKSCTLY